jgi:hypothetical protein
MVVIIMFICLDCGCVFDGPKHWIETHGLDSPPYEEWNGCPSCGGAYAETYKCDGCNDWLCGTYAETKNGNKYCENCYEIREVGE